MRFSSKKYTSCTRERHETTTTVLTWDMARGTSVSETLQAEGRRRRGDVRDGARDVAAHRGDGGPNFDPISPSCPAASGKGWGGDFETSQSRVIDCTTYQYTPQTCPKFPR
eukprot:185260-Prymnesium_polylepis.1